MGSMGLMGSDVGGLGLMG